MTKIKKQIGLELRSLRKTQKLSQAKLAELIGAPVPQTISNVERGAASYPPKYFKRLAKVLKVNPSTFVDLNLMRHEAMIMKQAGLK